MSKHPIIIWRAEEAPQGFQKEEVKWIAVVPRSMRSHYIGFIDENAWFLRYSYDVIIADCGLPAADDPGQGERCEGFSEEPTGEDSGFVDCFADESAKTAVAHNRREKYQYVWNFGKSVRAVTEADLSKAILVWDFGQAPQKYKQLCVECDEDWLAFLPLEALSPGFIDSDSFTRGSQFGLDVEIDWLGGNACFGADFAVYPVTRGFVLVSQH